MQKETLATHFGYNSKDGHGTMAVPIYQSTAYDFGSCETAANRFALKELGQIYSRLTNPTLDVFEARIAALEGAKAAISTSSGQAAIFYSIANLAEAGDNIIVAQKIYGGATTLLTYTIKRFGIKAKIFDSDNADDLEALIDDKTKAIFFETLSNPQIAISNVDKIVQIANRHNVITIADNTVATPILFNPLKKGVDVVVHSASKYISGQGLSVAGAIASRDGLNDKLVGNPRYAHFNTPDESYHGLVYSDLKGMFDLFTLRIRLSLLRDIGATLSAFNAFQLIQGLETLSIRIKEHSKNALKVAEFLEKHPKVKSVNYPGLASSKLNSYVKANFTDGLASGLLSFDVGDGETAAKILNNVKIFSVVVNIGDSKSIITHPASTTHQQLSKKELEDAGVSEGLIRLSIGLENADDLINDLKEAMQ
ncbi:aminotransferase class I/II-fold pyridoxal phosphate-dependent enzyme [Campylobacter fetus]|uniref:O-acetylhomoserine aminocarboxypropyltransferase/cysteine synthase family protein n=1 Tax=Campylobacter fetus TaxID=196 RepID=UPI0008187B19|nr:aminotransferase class I/II-fold pyridoxal phosphate-dependent enzyme [Campylobacter fetus]EAH8299396.1 O-acetylhomoserine aminocarboxypropyltransferase/cysteine synthase [Campylobacter fetus]EAI7231993.1 O-acetylhomoserine aminocarboxypropyltransferase/cysteine synthase [Campylobacter fetus]EAJ5689957.1 O-acetylhomoserine aminocarboxypropyltransferase/cysteine synthase [Campylobacter fetus]EAK0427501.1 O-acetylhomoserine aminocarboxypropyltransferase/cysteine synthase [Campylobacter fetus]